MTEPEPETPRAEQQTAARVARDAALQSLISNAVYLAIVLGVTVGIARRDFIARQAMRARRFIRQDWRTEREDAAVADLRRKMSEFDNSRDPGKWRQ
jgi:hypothetical protein